MSDRIADALRREFADGLWRAGATRSALFRTALGLAECVATRSNM